MVSPTVIRWYRVCVLLAEICAIAPALRAFAVYVFGPFHYFTYWIRAFGLCLVATRLFTTGPSKIGPECANVILNIPLFVAVGRESEHCTICTSMVEDVLVHSVLPILHWIDFFAFQASEARGGLSALMIVNVFCILYSLYIIVAVGMMDVVFPYGSESSAAAIWSFLLFIPGVAVICLLKRPLELHTWRAIIKW